MEMEKDLSEYEYRQLPLEDVMEMMKRAITQKQAFSLARYGHAEIYYALSASSSKYSKELNYCSNYNGATGDTNQIGKLLVNSLKNTHVVGLLNHEEHEYFHKETKRLLTSLSYTPQHVCSPFITHDMSKNSEFWSLLQPLRVVLVGRRAEEARECFESRSVNITETLQLEGVEQIDYLHQLLVLKKNEWDLAILAAGVPATILANRVARTTNNVVIDFGHALDVMMDGEQFDFNQLVEDFLENQ